MTSARIVTDTRRLIAQDFMLGVGGLLGPPGFLAFPISMPFEWTGLQFGIVTVSTACVVTWQYLSERTAFPTRAYDLLDHLRSHPLQLMLLTVVAIVVVTGPLYVYPGAIRIYYPGFLGLFVGLLTYRFVYGILRPIPEQALNRSVA